MGFNWLKKIFRKETTINNKTSDIATVDTSLVYVPKFSELDASEQEIVLQHLKKLKSDDKATLKYSHDLIDVSNRERMILSKTMERYFEWYGHNNQKPKSKSYEKTCNSVCYSILANLEFEIIIKKIIDIGKDLELRAVAFDLYIEQKKKERKPFRDIFVLAERIKRSTEKNQLSSERERLRVSIKNNNDILTTIYRDIKENDTLMTQFNLLQKVSEDKTFKNNKNLFSSVAIKDRLDLILYETDHLISGESLREALNNAVKEYGKSLVGKKTNEGIIITEEMANDATEHALYYGEDYTYKNLIEITPDDYIKELFQLTANLLHDIEVYRYEHQNDYKEYIADMNKTVADLEKTPTKDWPIEEAEEKAGNYSYKIYCFLKMMNNYITKEQRRKLIDSFNRLEFMVREGNGRGYFKYYDWLHEYYLDELGEELLTKVEKKYSVWLDDTRINRNHFIIHCGVYNSYIDFYDLLLDDLDAVDVYLNNGKKEFYEYLSETVSTPEREFLDKFIPGGSGLYAYLNRSHDYIQIEDIFYTLKFFGVKHYNIYDSDKLLESSSHHIEEGDMPKFIGTIKMHELLANYDERIRVVPKTISFYKYYGNQQRKRINNIDQLKNSIDVVALYLTTAEQLYQLMEVREKKPSEIKFIFVQESVLEEYRETFIEQVKQKATNVENKELLERWIEQAYIRKISNKDGYAKLIAIPDCTKYAELPKYLDANLEKEPSLKKVKAS